MSNINHIIVDILKKRNIDPSEFMSWSLSEIDCLLKLKNINDCAKFLLDNQDKNIAIYGDYDVDGITASSLLYHFFKLLGKEVQLFVPDRFINGYGLHKEIISTMINQKIDILITVDCGITNNDAADFAKKNNIDLIITDHHKDTSQDLPNAKFIINPNRRDEPFDTPFKDLAGVGVAFALCYAMKKINPQIPSIYPLLQYVAIGTIADMANLGNLLNLRLVRHGLRQLLNTSFLGLKILTGKPDLNQLMYSGENVSFNIAPMLNSKGRIEGAIEALKLLTTDDIDEASTLFFKLDASNHKRKMLQSRILEEADQSINLKDPATFVYNSSWHEGVIGIVASKLVDKYKRPAIVLTKTVNELIKGSARSYADIDLYKILNNCSHLFTKFGGHSFAAGMSLELKNLEPFKKQLFSELSKIKATTINTEIFDIDAKYITAELVKQLELMGPYGVNNPRPVFKIKDVSLDNYQILKDKHLSLTIKTANSAYLRGISFNYQNKKINPTLLKNKNLILTFTLGINYFNGNQFLQLFIDSITENICTTLKHI